MSFGLDFVVWVSGMVLLVAGIYLRMDPQTNHVMTAAYADNVRLFHLLCYVLIGFGSVVTFVGFLGCCGAFQESRCMVAAFFAVLFALFTTEVLIGTWAFLHIDKIKVSVPATVSDYVKNVYGKHQLNDEPIDYVQQSLICCGGVDAYDWSWSAWSNQTNTDSRHHTRLFRVPVSCCVNRTSPSATLVATVTSGMISPNEQILQPVCISKQTVAVHRGCGTALLDWLNAQLLTFAVAMLALLGVQFISLCLSLVLCCGMRRQSAGGYKT
jgi:hypothetical protein